MIFNQVFIQPRAERLIELIEENEIQKRIMKQKQPLPPIQQKAKSVLSKTQKVDDGKKAY